MSQGDAAHMADQNEARKGRRELSTSKRAAQNRAGGYASADVAMVVHTVVTGIAAVSAVGVVGDDAKVAVRDADLLEIGHGRPGVIMVIEQAGDGAGHDLSPDGDGQLVVTSPL